MTTYIDNGRAPPTSAFGGDSSLQKPSPQDHLGDMLPGLIKLWFFPFQAYQNWVQAMTSTFSPTAQLKDAGTAQLPVPPETLSGSDELFA